MNGRALLAAAGGSASKLYVEDVFSAYPYTGNGGTQTITNGIDLTDNGGMVWIKDRTNGSNYHVLNDTVRGTGLSLNTNGNYAQSSDASTRLSAFNNNGFSLGSHIFVNASGDTYASWTFRRAAKFFDVVTWTGDGTSNRQIAHALGLAPGMVTVKRRDSTGDWITRHRSATGELYLDASAAQAGSFTQITATSASSFSVSGNANISGATYVAYVWAHDPDTVNGVVQCGIYTGSGAVAGPVINLGWEPQYVLTKSASGTSDWIISDTSRGMSAGNALWLYADSSAAEISPGVAVMPQASGFQIVTTAGAINSSGAPYIYLAIRRGPMRTPTSGTQVYNAIARAGTGAATTVTGAGFPPDMVHSFDRNGSGGQPIFDRLRGALAAIQTPTSAAEISTYTDTLTGFDVMNGIRVGADASTAFINYSSQPYINHFFRRAPGFFDIVCYKGTGTAQTLAHNLGVTPGMMWVKDRTSTSQWAVYHQALGATEVVSFTNTAAGASSGPWNNAAPSTTGFTVGTSSWSNNSGDNYVAYLFAALPGVSAIGSYTGTGAAQTINCGFTNGARFVLIKRTDSTGDWLVLDTVRGVIVGNDPYLLLDSSVAEVTTADLLTPQASGFGLTTNALVNTSGGTYIYFAVA